MRSIFDDPRQSVSRPSSIFDEINKISGEEWRLLNDLNAIGAATPMELAIRTGRIGQDLRPMLQRLLESGLVERKLLTGGYENEIYWVSSEGRRLIS